jgi:hypothetical protein
MFESIWKRERASAGKVAAVAVIAAVVLAGQVALFAATIGEPLQTAVASVGTLAAREAARNALPEVTEEIVVVAPHRVAKPAKHARVGPWRADARHGEAAAAQPCTPEG